MKGLTSDGKSLTVKTINDELTFLTNLLNSQPNKDYYVASRKVTKLAKLLKADKLAYLQLKIEYDGSDKSEVEPVAPVEEAYQDVYSNLIVKNVQPELLKEINELVKKIEDLKLIKNKIQVKSRITERSKIVSHGNEIISELKDDASIAVVAAGLDVNKLDNSLQLIRAIKAGKNINKLIQKDVVVKTVSSKKRGFYEKEVEVLTIKDKELINFDELVSNKREIKRLPKNNNIDGFKTL